MSAVHTADVAWPASSWSAAFGAKEVNEDAARWQERSTSWGYKLILKGVSSPRNHNHTNIKIIALSLATFVSAIIT